MARGRIHAPMPLLSSQSMIIQCLNWIGENRERERDREMTRKRKRKKSRTTKITEHKWIDYGDVFRICFLSVLLFYVYLLLLLLMIVVFYICVSFSSLLIDFGVFVTSSTNTIRYDSFAEIYVSAMCWRNMQWHPIDFNTIYMFTHPRTNILRVKIK